jgi:MFS family permease
MPHQQPAVPKRSLSGLNAANFFQAEMIGVILPVLNGFLKDAGWRYDSIGLATAVAGLGTLLFQTPAGRLTDRLACRRTLFAVTAWLTGICLAVLPWIPRTPAWVDPLLFLSGATQSFFTPVLAALALALAGYARLSRVAGANQSWNHAGNIAAALLAIALVSRLGLNSIFYFAGVCSLLAGASVYLIRDTDLDERAATGRTTGGDAEVPWSRLLCDRTVLFLFASIFLFHLANAPILPAVALYVKKLGGSNSLMTATVLTAQTVMVPVAWLTGRLLDAWGRKPVLAIAFWILPLRIVSYALVRTPTAVVWLQGLGRHGRRYLRRGCDRLLCRSYAR